METGSQAGPKRNFQILSPLDFLAEFTQHIPPKGSHLIRYYGWYSNKSRGMRKKAEAGAAGESSPEVDAQREAPARCSQTWAMLIKRVYEIDPMVCPKCGSEMAVVAFIEPPQKEVIDKILAPLRPVAVAGSQSRHLTPMVWSTNSSTWTSTRSWRLSEDSRGVRSNSVCADVSLTP